ncbi:hypothetical protein AIGOOFII_0179 [Methylobacterium marchantiae]|nr:hypothetical protein AIGOOFII_0179 [Methylobacterium marchantiae]
MRDASERGHEAEILRRQLALLATETKLIRLRQSLARKYDPAQPRAPAGQSDGGRWVGPGGGGGDGLIDRLPRGQARWASLQGGTAQGSSTPEETTTEDGARILSLRIHSGRGEWDDQHAVVTPDGESRIFENSGETQTIRDGASGEVLSSGTFASPEPQAEATVQQVFLPAAPFVVAPAVAATLEAAALLFTYLEARKPGFGKAPGRTALRYDFDPDPDPEKKLPLIWVGQIDQARLDQACPRNAEVQAVTDEATKRLTALNPLLTRQQLGTMIHVDVAKTFTFKNYPDVRVELSISSAGEAVKYGKKDSVRLDLYELSPNQTVCVYDYKTGNEGLEPARALLLARIAKMHYPQARGMVIIQVRPIK